MAPGPLVLGIYGGGGLEQPVENAISTYVQVCVVHMRCFLFAGTTPVLRCISNSSKDEFTPLVAVATEYESEGCNWKVPDINLKSRKSTP